MISSNSRLVDFQNKIHLLELVSSRRHINTAEFPAFETTPGDSHPLPPLASPPKLQKSKSGSCSACTWRGRTRNWTRTNQEPPGGRESGASVYPMNLIEMIFF